MKSEIHPWVEAQTKLTEQAELVLAGLEITTEEVSTDWDDLGAHVLTEDLGARRDRGREQDEQQAQKAKSLHHTLPVVDSFAKHRRMEKSGQAGIVGSTTQFSTPAVVED